MVRSVECWHSVGHQRGSHPLKPVVAVDAQRGRPWPGAAAAPAGEDGAPVAAHWSRSAKLQLNSPLRWRGAASGTLGVGARAVWLAFTSARSGMLTSFMDLPDC